MRAQLKNTYQAVRTILIGMGITLRYCFARTITVQYPDVPPTIKPRFRGFHWYEIERCSACGNCARACPVDCITIEKSGPRKIEKETGISRGGAMTRYAIDYSKCMFCGLCTENCPTDCIHMGDLHDHSGFTRQETTVEFTELARQGLQAPMPLWARKRRLPAWAQAVKDAWQRRAEPRVEEMRKALTEQPIAKPAPVAKPAAEPAPKPPPPPAK